jgi:hypothetical protein
MEREFYTTDFENLLKENADQFKLTPSKKVWHGIYNDLHPGRRWPSAVMSLAFIFSLVIIGHLNTQQSQHSYLTNLQKNPQSQKNAPLQQALNNRVYNDNPVNEVSQRSVNGRANKVDEKPSAVALENVIPFNNSELTGIQKNNYEPGIMGTAKEVQDLAINKTDLKNVNKLSNEFSGKVGAPDNLINAMTDVAPEATTTDVDFAKNSAANFRESRILKTAIQMQPVHVPILKVRRNSKVSWNYYLSPFVSYRAYSKQDGILKSDVNQHPSAGLEAGSAMKYSLTKKLKFISGFQMNYSEYAIQANNIHPVMATLLLYNKEGVPYSISSISFYGNGPGSAPVNLHNYSFQLSLPVGFEYKLAGNNDIQLNAFTTFQPLFVVDNRAYILSTDKKNYITQASLSHRWNMSSNFGTFISFNSNKFNWQIGPQVYYQLFSSYSSAYPLREHFIDYGIRLGISKIVR